MSSFRLWLTRRSSRAYLIGTVAMFAVFVVAQRFSGDPRAAALTDLAFTGFGVAALVACVVAASNAPASQRIGWRVFAVGSASWTAGHLVVDGTGLSVGPAAVSDLLFLIAPLLYAVG